MVKTTHYALMRRAVKNFPANVIADKESVKHLRRTWMSSVLFLGDRWLFKKELKRREPGMEYYA